MAGRAVLRRTVEVSNQHKGSYGTGCLIAPGLVLTAHHVALPGEDSVAVRDTASAGFTQAAVVWESTELDAVLLKADRALVGAGMGVVRWGELVCDYPGRRPVCSMTGFPKAMRRQAAARSEQYVDDLKTVEGTIAPHTGSRSKLYALEVDGAVPTDVKNWQLLHAAGTEFFVEVLQQRVPQKPGLGEPRGRIAAQREGYCGAARANHRHHGC